MNTAYKEFPKGSVISVIGAGGKTTLVHKIADWYRAMGWRVLVSTTTHMMVEEPLYQSAALVRQALDRCGYAFAGTIDPRKNVHKLCSLPESELCEAIKAADITILEADGSRRLPFKVPYDHEPVINELTTQIIIVGGMWAIGHPLKEVTYNLEGVLALPITDEAGERLTEETPLTPEIMARAYSLTFGKRMAQEHPCVMTDIYAGQQDSPVMRQRAEAFYRSYPKG